MHRIALARKANQPAGRETVEWAKRKCAHHYEQRANGGHDAALALLYLTLHDGYRAWKGFDWDVLGRLHEKGMIGDPVGKVKSVVFTDEGLERAERLFKEMFEE